MTFLTRLETVVKLRHAAADLSLKSAVAWWPDLDWRVGCGAVEAQKHDRIAR